MDAVESLPSSIDPDEQEKMVFLLIFQLKVLKIILNISYLTED